MSSTRSASRRLRAERLTDITEISSPRSSQVRHWERLASTKAVSGRIRPVCADGMKSSGKRAAGVRVQRIDA